MVSSEQRAVSRPFATEVIEAYMATKPRTRPKVDHLRKKIADVKAGLTRFAQALTGNYKLRLIFRGSNVTALIPRLRRVL